MKQEQAEKLLLSLHEKHADALFRHAFFRVYDREKAKDLVQDAYMKTWDYLRQGNEIRQPKAFLFRVVNNLVIDYHRKRKEASLDSMIEDGFQPATRGDELFDQVANEHDVWSLLKALDDEEREIITMRFIEGLTPKQIASVLGMTPNAASVRIHRVKAKLKEQTAKL